MDEQYTLTGADVRIKLVDSGQLYSYSPFDNADSAVDAMTDVLKRLDREYVCVINLDNKSRPINYHIASIGTLDAAMVTIPNIFKTAFLSNAASVILMHNHPSGELDPSDADINITKKVAAAGYLLDTPLLDHIIVGGVSGKYISLRDDMPEIFDPGNAVNMNVDKAADGEAGKDKTDMETYDISYKEPDDDEIKHIRITTSDILLAAKKFEDEYPDCEPYYFTYVSNEEGSMPSLSDKETKELHTGEDYETYSIEKDSKETEDTMKENEAIGLENNDPSPDSEKTNNNENLSDTNDSVFISFSNKNMTEPFTNKSGKSFVSIRIPNQDPDDHTPWQRFVVPENFIHHNTNGKSCWIRLYAKGTTTLHKSVNSGKVDENGKKIYEDYSRKVSNTELKSIVEFYKNKSIGNKTAEIKAEGRAESPDSSHRQDQFQNNVKKDVVFIKFGVNFTSDPFKSRNGRDLVAVSIPNENRNDHTPWQRFVVPLNFLHKNEGGRSYWIRLPADGTTYLHKSVDSGRVDENGKKIYEDYSRKVSNTELKSIVEFYKKEVPESSIPIASQTRNVTENNGSLRHESTMGSADARSFKNNSISEHGNTYNNSYRASAQNTAFRGPKI